MYFHDYHSFLCLVAMYTTQLPLVTKLNIVHSIMTMLLRYGCHVNHIHVISNYSNVYIGCHIHNIIQLPLVTNELFTYDCHVNHTV